MVFMRKCILMYIVRFELCRSSSWFIFTIDCEVASPAGGTVQSGHTDTVISPTV